MAQEKENFDSAHRRLIDTMICANAEGYTSDGEVLVTPIGLLPRIAASLAMLSCNTDIMMTDSEAFLLSTPNAVGARRSRRQANESWMGLSRVFDNVWGGMRHITCGPSQIDCYGQANISMIGGKHDQPRVQMLGVRGFPGNSICHANTFLVLDHNRRVFVGGECDYVCTIGYNPARLPRGYSFADIDLRQIITNLCVMDFGGKDCAIRVRSLHRGVSIEQVCDNTGFQLQWPGEIPETSEPTEEQLQLIASIDPEGLRYR